MSRTSGIHASCLNCGTRTFHTEDHVSESHKIRKCHPCGRTIEILGNEVKVVSEGRKQVPEKGANEASPAS